MPDRSRRLFQSILAGIARFWRRAPATALLACAVVAFHLAKGVSGLFWTGGRRGIDAAFGAVVPLTTYRLENAADPSSPLVPIHQLEGPFDLWDGQWWRIFVSAFQHADVVHLAINVVALCYLGSLLEPRLKRRWYVVFFLVATGISLIPEFLMEHYAVGISGGLCAVFGYLLMLRKTDWRLREVLTDASIRSTMIFLVACIPLTMIGAVNIANAAHFTGLVYGLAAGGLFAGGLARSLAARAAFVASHAIVPFALYLCVHPTWNGRYYWHLAHRAAAVGRWNDYKRDLERAVHVDRRLVECWNELAEYHLQIAHDPLAAWRTMITGLHYNRSDDEGVDIARTVFNQLPPKKREEALDLLRQEFGDDAVNWRERLTHASQPAPLASRAGKFTPSGSAVKVGGVPGRKP